MSWQEDCSVKFTLILYSWESEENHGNLNKSALPKPEFLHVKSDALHTYYPSEWYVPCSAICLLTLNYRTHIHIIVSYTDTVLTRAATPIFTQLLKTFAGWRHRVSGIPPNSSETCFRKTNTYTDKLPAEILILFLETRLGEGQKVSW
jgi:hypothetical protein